MAERKKECNISYTGVDSSAGQNQLQLESDSQNLISIENCSARNSCSNILNDNEIQVYHSTFENNTQVNDGIITHNEATITCNTINEELKEVNSKNRDDKHQFMGSNDNEEMNNKNMNINLQLYRDDLTEESDNSDSSDTDSSSTVSEDNEDSENASLSDKSELAIKMNCKSMRTKGELGIEDLPPIEDLKIIVDENKCKPIGSILNIVDTMVVVQSFLNTPPLDIDTVLFLDRGQRVLGKIFEVFGPVREPLYCIRFNSREHIKAKNIIKEQVVYCAPQTEYTSYIHTAELLKNKGSDASWIDNNEPPVTCLDFSDDEEESKMKNSKIVVGFKRESQTDNDMFVKKMNQKNLELTAKRRKEDEAKQKRIPIPRRVISNVNNSSDGINMNSHSFSQYTDNFKLKTRTLMNSDQSCLNSFHPNSSNTHLNKFDSTARSINFLVGGYNSPSNFSFPPQHLMCSSPGQLPNVSHNTQNYLTMYSRPPMHSSTAMPPPFSGYNSPSIPSVGTFSAQQPMHPTLPPPLHPSMPQFTNFNPLSTPPLPSSVPQPNFFPCTDSPPVHQPAFIPLNVRPSISTSFHPQFVLPPPPPPPPPVMQHHPHQREITIPHSERRIHSSHQTNKSFYPNSSFNS